MINFKNWRDVIEHHMHASPGWALQFLIDAKEKTDSIGYADLDRRARAIAAELQSRKLRGERALLLFAPGLRFVEAVFGCFYSGVLAVPVYPPHPTRFATSAEKLTHIVGDCTPAVILADSMVSLLKPKFDELEAFADREWCVTDKLDEGLADAYAPNTIRGEDVAFLQYTSGSTSAPKGVIVTHDSLLANSQVIHAKFEFDRNLCVVSWLPCYHDMGLIGTILQPLFVGGNRGSTLMSPLHFINEPFSWLRAISRLRGNVAGGPNFAYELCVQKISDERVQELDLSSWELAFTGAERVRPDTLRRFSEKFGAAQFDARAFYPCYGMAESTLFITGGLRSEVAQPFSVDATALNNGIVEEGDDIELMTCGTVAAKHEVRIVDLETRTECAENTIGEIWTRGPSVCQGYWKKPELSRATFDAELDGNQYLRTGDLGFLRAGELYITGRLKEMLVIHGRNFFPEDIEEALRGCHPAYEGAVSVAISIEDGVKETLAVVSEIPRHCKFISKTPSGFAVDGTLLAEVVAAMRRQASQGLRLNLSRVVFVARKTLPRTTSGKIRRLEIARLLMGGKLTTIADI